MSAAAMAARLVLGASFLWSGTAKSTASGRIAFERGVRGFGFGSRSAAVIVGTLPIVELVLGALLVTGVAVRAAALVALVLLAGFSAVITRTLRRGDRVDCGCFGASRGRPVGSAALLRNAALAGAAALSATEGAAQAPWGPGDTVAPMVLVAAAVLAAGALVASAARLRP